jgi:predicted transposase/invertase (TIGR01784 family)
MEYRYEEGVEKGKQEGLEKGKQAGLEEGLMKGKQEGLEEGVIKGKLQTATNMKKSGIDLQTIVDCTGLSMEEVENL